MLTVRQSMLSRSSALAFLGSLIAETAAARTLYILRGTAPDDLARWLSDAAVPEIIPQVCRAATTSQTGAAIFWDRSQKYMLLPPFPIIEKRDDHGFNVSPMQDMLTRSLKIAIVLVRFRAYAIGLCDDQRLVASKIGTGNIHSRHRQGGSSSARFSRHREKQIEAFLTRLGGHIEEMLGLEARSVNYIAYGGSTEGIRRLRRTCKFLHQLDDRELPPLLDLEEPRQRVLEHAVNRLWSSKLFEWRPEE